MSLKPVRNILFITSTRLGDAVLSTGLLHHLVTDYPNASITVAAGQLPASLFQSFPSVKRVIAVDKKPYAQHWLNLYKEVYKTKWDSVVDLRDSIISRVIWAPQKYRYSTKIKKHYGSAHKVIQLSRVLSETGCYAPTLYVDHAHEKQITALIASASRPIIAVGPTANWPGKSWPLDYYIALCEKLFNSKHPQYQNCSIMVLASKAEEPSARLLYNTLPDNRRIDMIAKGDVAITAAALKKANLYIGNDSGLMHMASALRIPTFGLFGPSYDEYYRPFGEHCAFIRTAESAQELLTPENLAKGYHQSLMTSLTVETVYEAVTQFFQTVIDRKCV